MDRNARTHLSPAATAAVAAAAAPPLVVALLRRLIDVRPSVGADYVTYDVTARGRRGKNSPTSADRRQTVEACGTWKFSSAVTREAANVKFGVAVAALGAATKLLYVEPG